MRDERRSLLPPSVSMSPAAGRDPSRDTPDDEKHKSFAYRFGVLDTIIAITPQVYLGGTAGYTFMVELGANDIGWAFTFSIGSILFIGLLYTSAVVTYKLFHYFVANNLYNFSQYIKAIPTRLKIIVETGIVEYLKTNWLRDILLVVQALTMLFISSCVILLFCGFSASALNIGADQMRSGGDYLADDYDTSAARGLQTFLDFFSDIFVASKGSICFFSVAVIILNLATFTAVLMDIKTKMAGAFASLILEKILVDKKDIEQNKKQLARAKFLRNIVIELFNNNNTDSLETLLKKKEWLISSDAVGATYVCLGSIPKDKGLLDGCLDSLIDKIKENCQSEVTDILKLAFLNADKESGRNDDDHKDDDAGTPDLSKSYAAADQHNELYYETLRYTLVRNIISLIAWGGACAGLYYFENVSKLVEENFLPYILSEEQIKPWSKTIFWTAATAMLTFYFVNLISDLNKTIDRITQKRLELKIVEEKIQYARGIFYSICAATPFVHSLYIGIKGEDLSNGVFAFLMATALWGAALMNIVGSIRTDRDEAIKEIEAGPESRFGKNKKGIVRLVGLFDRAVERIEAERVEMAYSKLTCFAQR